MRNLLALVGLLVIGIAGVGWYMGWYKLSYSRGTDGTLEIKTDVNTKKVGEDTSDILKNASSTVGDHLGKAAQDAQTTTPPTPGGTPGPVAPGSAFNPLAPAAPNAPAVPNAPIAPPTQPTRGPITLIPPK